MPELLLTEEFLHHLRHHMYCNPRAPQLNIGQESGVVCAPVAILNGERVGPRNRGAGCLPSTEEM